MYYKHAVVGSKPKLGSKSRKQMPLIKKSENIKTSNNNNRALQAQKENQRSFLADNPLVWQSASRGKMPKKSHVRS